MNSTSTPSAIATARVSVEITRVGVEILGGPELGGVDEQAHHDGVVRGARGAHERTVPFVEEAHGGHKADRATACAHVVAHGTDVGDALDDDHASSSNARHNAGSWRPDSRCACSASARYAGSLVDGNRLEVASHGVDVAACHRTGERGFGSEGLDVLESRAHERDERGQRHARGLGEPGSLSEQRDEMIGRDGGGRVIRDTVTVADAERAHAQGDREPLDVGGAVDRAP